MLHKNLKINTIPHFLTLWQQLPTPHLTIRTISLSTSLISSSLSLELFFNLKSIRNHSKHPFPKNNNKSSTNQQSIDPRILQSIEFNYLAIIRKLALTSGHKKLDRLNKQIIPLFQRTYRNILTDFK